MMRRDLGQCCLNSHPLAVCILQRDRSLMSKKDILMSTPPGRCAGKSILEHYEDELDEVMVALFDRIEFDRHYPNPNNEDNACMGCMEPFPCVYFRGNDGHHESLDLLKGKAQALTWAIALIGNPYYPNEEAVKNAAMVRYEERYEDEGDEDSSRDEEGELSSH